jgi:restriction endonuclease S subunit
MIKSKDFRYIGEEFEVSKLAGFEYTEYFTNKNMTSSESYIALTSKNIQKNFLDLNDYITIDKNVADKFLQRSKLHKNDIILSYTGEYRRALKLYEENYQLGPNVCRIRPKNNCQIKSGLLSVFLNLDIGQSILNKEKTLSAQPTVAMSRIRKIPIPKFSDNFQSIIESLVDKQHEMNEMSVGLYKEVEKEFDQVIDYQENGNNINYNIKSYKESVKNSNRLDAEYYQLNYEKYNEFIRNYNGSKRTVGDICNIYDKNFIPENDKTYKYIELSNVRNNMDILDVREIIGSELPTRARRMVKKGQVIVSSIEGSLNSCAIIDEEFDGAICSNGFFVIDSEYIESNCLLVLFKSKLMQSLMKQQCTGTILTCINKEDLKKIEIPILDKSIQDRVSNKLRKTFELRQKSKDLLEIAKKAIQIAIEKNEDEAIKYINQSK